MKFLLSLFLLIQIGSCALAQQRGKNSLEGSPLNERLYFGGGGSFGGGTDAGGYRYTYVSVSPIVGYRVTRPFNVGAAINYIYYNYPDVKVSLHQYGISPFAQYMVGKLFGYAEYSHNQRTLVRQFISIGVHQVSRWYWILTTHWTKSLNQCHGLVRFKV